MRPSAPHQTGQIKRRASTRSLPRAIRRDIQVATARALRTQVLSFLLHMVFSEGERRIQSRIAPAHHVEAFSPYSRGPLAPRG
jgi:hypothetical protein